MRDEVLAVALEMFAERGFEEVTTAEIAAVAGVSPRSFFRYFPTKEDVLLGSIRDAGVLVRDRLVERPADEGAWQALLQAFRVLVDHPVYPPQHLAAIARITLETPSVRARDLQKYQEWEELLVPDVSARIARRQALLEEDADDGARAVVGAAIAALRVATQQWLRSGGKSDPLSALDALVATIRHD
jgi:AcrR family transcriptional regulator